MVASLACTRHVLAVFPLLSLTFFGLRPTSKTQIKMSMALKVSFSIHQYSSLNSSIHSQLKVPFSMDIENVEPHVYMHDRLLSTSFSHGNSKNEI